MLALAGALGYEGWLGANQIRIQQSLIEDENRTQVGLWLKNHVRPHERVYLEPLGYIGYFSNARMMDYPGLVSDEVVRARRRGENFWTIVGDLKPEWLVLRPDEAREMVRYPFLQVYRFEQKFDVSQQVSKSRPCQALATCSTMQFTMSSSVDLLVLHPFHDSADPDIPGRHLIRDGHIRKPVVSRVMPVRGAPIILVLAGGIERVVNLSREQLWRGQKEEVREGSLPARTSILLHSKPKLSNAGDCLVR